MDKKNIFISSAKKIKEEGFINDNEFSLLINDILSNNDIRINNLLEIYTMVKNNILRRDEYDKLRQKFFNVEIEVSGFARENVEKESQISETQLAVETSAAKLRQKEVRSTVNTFSIIASIIGLLPLPIADAPLLILTQFFMMKKLCSKYDRHLGIGIILIVISAFLGPIVFSSFAKLFPGLGSILGACIGGGFTYLVGNTTAKILENNEEFNWENIKKALLNKA